jgi:hypothetical protein
MLKQSERKAVAFGLIAVLTLVIAFFVADLLGEGAGEFAPVVEQVRYTVGLGLLGACGLLACYRSGLSADTPISSNGLEGLSKSSWTDVMLTALLLPLRKEDRASHQQRCLTCSLCAWKRLN